MSNPIKLSARLAACAALVRNGKRLADVGCDHGYVPASLVLDGRITSAVASDINAAPLESCRRLVRDYGLDDKITCVLSDGLQNVDGDCVDDILLAGMGGELIADILQNCPFASEKHISINAMTHPEIARRWLYEHGFEIANDIIVPEGRHHYSVLDAHYTGVVTGADDFRCFLGEISDFSDREFFIHLLNYLHNKQKGGEDYTAVIAEIEKRL